MHLGQAKYLSAPTYIIMVPNANLIFLMFLQRNIKKKKKSNLQDLKDERETDITQRNFQWEKAMQVNFKVIKKYHNPKTFTSSKLFLNENKIKQI